MCNGVYCVTGVFPTKRDAACATAQSVQKTFTFLRIYELTSCQRVEIDHYLIPLKLNNGSGAPVHHSSKGDSADAQRAEAQLLPQSLSVHHIL